MLGESHPRRIVVMYAGYNNEARTHLSLGKDAPISRPTERFGHVVARAPGWRPASPRCSNLAFGRDRGNFLPALMEVPSKKLEALQKRAVQSTFDFIDFGPSISTRSRGSRLITTARGRTAA
jgi:hypothetical protein